MNKKQISAYVEARYPGAKRNNRSGGWDTKRSYPPFISDEDAEVEAEAEVEMAESGYAAVPAWLKQ